MKNEINSRPKKVEITWDLFIPAVKSITESMAAEIGGIISGNGGQKTTGSVSVTLSEIKTRMNTVFAQSDDKKKYIASSLMIGFLADSKMMETMTLPK